ncbi:MAG: protein disulfide oxidoreductase [Candidatus Thorarchaeota archaeon]|jgi:glutaredoxin-like protein
MVVEIDEDTQAQVRELFEPMVDDVTMHVFIEQEKCLYCNDVRSMAEQISDLSEKVILEIHEGPVGEGKAAEFGVEHVPATILHGKEPYNIKFYGIAAGHEFGALIGSIVDVSMGAAQLPPDIVEDIEAIDKPIHIQVFTTPQCPYCPGMVRLANQAAIINPLIQSDMIESLEFQDLATKYEVFGVPKTIFNDTVTVEGLTPPVMFIEKLYEAIGE